MAGFSAGISYYAGVGRAETGALLLGVSLTSSFLAGTGLAFYADALPVLAGVALPLGLAAGAYLFLPTCLSAAAAPSLA